MSHEIMVAVLSLIGTLAGTFAGILTANKLTEYRIHKLEERIEEMDTLDQRLDKVEMKQAIQDQIVESIRQEIDRNINDIRELKGR